MRIPDVCCWCGFNWSRHWKWGGDFACQHQGLGRTSNLQTGGGAGKRRDPLLACAMVAQCFFPGQRMNFLRETRTTTGTIFRRISRLMQRPADPGSGTGQGDAPIGQRPAAMLVARRKIAWMIIGQSSRRSTLLCEMFRWVTHRQAASFLTVGGRCVVAGGVSLVQPGVVWHILRGVLGEVSLSFDPALRQSRRISRRSVPGGHGNSVYPCARGKQRRQGRAEQGWASASRRFRP